MMTRGFRSAKIPIMPESKVTAGGADHNLVLPEFSFCIAFGKAVDRSSLSGAAVSALAA